MTKIVYRTEIFAEGGCYVGICPELNVSSFGDTQTMPKVRSKKLWMPSSRSADAWEL